MVGPDVRSDGGPTIFLPARGTRWSYRKWTENDADFGATELVRVDHEGFCNDAAQAEAESVDVVMAGDSFTFCSGMTVEDTAAYRLQGFDRLAGIQPRACAAPVRTNISKCLKTFCAGAPPELRG